MAWAGLVSVWVNGFHPLPVKCMAVSFFGLYCRYLDVVLGVINLLSPM